MWLLTSTYLVFIMQLGFALLEAGCQYHTHNVGEIARAPLKRSLRRYC
jgi:ammonia channel protein AmtB